MKRLTLKNFEMAMNLIMAKGYTKLQANDIAINCFALASNFGGNVEQYIQKIDETTSAEQNNTTIEGNKIPSFLMSGDVYYRNTMYAHSGRAAD